MPEPHRETPRRRAQGVHHQPAAGGTVTRSHGPMVEDAGVWTVFCLPGDHMHQRGVGWGPEECLQPAGGNRKRIRPLLRKRQR